MTTCKRCKFFNMNTLISECRNEMNFPKQLDSNTKNLICSSLVEKHVQLHQEKLVGGSKIARTGGMIESHKKSIKKHAKKMLSKLSSCDSKRIHENEFNKIVNIKK